MSIQKNTSRRQSAAPLFVGQSATDDSPDDFVAYLIRVMVTAGVKAEVAGTVGQQVTEEWGGDRPYIAKRLGEGRSERNEAIRRDFQRGESIPFLMRRYQLSRVTIWRILGLEAAA